MNKCWTEVLRALPKIVELCKYMPDADRVLWSSRIAHVYGDMQGQRSVDIQEICKSYGIKNYKDVDIDIVISLEFYYYLICNFIAYSVFQKDRAQFFPSLTSYNSSHFRTLLDKIVSGKVFTDEGFLGCEYAFDFQWVTDNASNDDIKSLKYSLSYLQFIWHNDETKFLGLDPLQQVHHEMFPKNLIHVTGQFYTPQWLAQLLVKNISWDAEKLLIDPFCGTGVFLISALEFACKKGFHAADVIPNILGVDLNPFAAASARANIAIYFKNKYKKISKPISLNVISADTLAPAVAATSKFNTDLFNTSKTINIDGNTINLSDIESSISSQTADEILNPYGLDLCKWNGHKTLPSAKLPDNLTFTQKRRIYEQLFVLKIKRAEYLLTNPPWVGWEYMSRPYRDSIQDAWQLYDLFKAKGLEAAFLKEDLSTLALIVAWDSYLAEYGKSAVVLRPAAMFSDLTARGLRRLSLSDQGKPIKLTHINTFNNLRIFSEANTDVATWEVQKGYDTIFPVDVTEWQKQSKKWSPAANLDLEGISQQIKPIEKQAVRTDPSNKESRWLISDSKTIESLALIRGTNKYVPRMGVFTGGANAVYYLEYKKSISHDIGLYANITKRAKRVVAQQNVELEKNIVHSIVRGKDISMWNVKPQVHILCPHTIKTKMYPIPHSDFQSNFPLAFNYLLSMKETLCERKGFAGWEKDIHKKYFYTLQRIGEYTFAPYKVCWKYIASEFTLCVISNDDNGKPLLPNDKVMFIPFYDMKEAFFLCGILSSSLIGQYVNSSASKRQISTNIIKTISLPTFNKRDERHLLISSICQEGHSAAAKADRNLVDDLIKELDEHVSKIYAT